MLLMTRLVAALAVVMSGSGTTRGPGPGSREPARPSPRRNS